MLHENDSRSGHPSWMDDDVYTGEPREQLPLNPLPMTDDSIPPTYDRDALLTRAELARGLRVTERQTYRLNLPTCYVGKTEPRFLWGQILDTLADRARQGAA